MKKETLHETELAARLGTSVLQIRAWAKDGKFSKKVHVKIVKDQVDVTYCTSDTEDMQRDVTRWLDQNVRFL